MNKTVDIFSQGAPYANPYQGISPRVLCVCTVGMLRSPTMAEIGIKEFGFNCRAAGADTSVALIPLSANLILWATTIVFLGDYAYTLAKDTFKGTEFLETIDDKCLLSNIQDSYNFRDKKLIRMCTQFLNIHKDKIEQHADRLTINHGYTYT